MMLAGALIGFAFLAKMMQAFLVLPGFALVYLLLAPVALRRRLLHLVAAGAAMIAAAGWWIAIVQLWPAASRPYIGGSTNNSVLELALGYNGLSRISGSTNGPQSGTPGLLRLFGVELGGQVAWFLPAALVALVVGLVYTARRPRTDRVRAGLAIWGGWLLITGAVFSLMAGIFHGYYTVALAPAIAALVGIGAGLLWERRDSLLASGVLAGTVALTGAWSFVLLSRAGDYLPTLRWAVLVASLLAAGGLAGRSRLGTSMRRAVVTLAVVAALAGPAAWSVQTAATAHTGSMPTAGPTLTASSGTQGAGGTHAFAGGGPSGGGAPPTGTPPTGAGQAPSSSSAASGSAGTNAGGGGGGGASTQVEALIAKNASSYTWVAATTGAQTAAGYQLATGDPVMAIGGFNGGDNSPTLAQFKAYVAAGKVHYYIAGSQGGGQGTGSAAQIATWVAAHFTAQTVGTATVYDLTA
jgi:4-amino-4-deoxy-L-arabinose transferase-like glycosyltransferase